jgi:glycosyltransferase involved in cell wall biosynthesis
MAKLAIFLMDLAGGGAERVMINLALGFANRGLNVDLVLVKAEGPYLFHLPSNINLVKLEKSRLLLSLPALIRYLRQTRPTILMSALEDTNTVALWARKLAGVSTRVIVTVHNHLSCESQNSTQLKRRLTPQLVKMFYPWADHVVAVSQGVASDLIKIGIEPQKVQAIYNPIVTSELRLRLQETIEHPWFEPGQPPVILGVGRLTRQKDFSTLLRAFAQLNRRNTSRLMILGEGEERIELEKLARELGIAENVMFPGFVTNPYAYMTQAKAVVLSSAWEGFGNVLVEAMAAGTPVIATDCESGPAEILANGKYGKLVRVGNPEEMAIAIAATFEHSVDVEELKKRAEEFTLEKATTKYSNLF